MTPAQRNDVNAQLPPLTDDEIGAADTQPLWAPGTPAADAHIARLQEIGLITTFSEAMTPDVDGDDDDEQ